MREFIEKESYKHLFAKNLLKKWFLQQEETKEDYCKVAQFEWRKNYGIFTELKFYETSDPYYFESSEGLTPDNRHSENGKDLQKENPENWFDPNFDRGKILFVPDVTIFHKGTPAMLLEIVHRSPLTNQKIKKIRKFFTGYHIELYQIEAEEILRHDKSIIPNFLKCKQVL